MYNISCLTPSNIFVYGVARSRYRNTHPQKNATPIPSISKDDTEIKFTIIYGINNTSITSRKPLDSIQNRTLPTPFIVICDLTPLSTKKFESIYEILRNIDLIPIICQEYRLSKNHASIPLNTGQPLPKGPIIKENYLLCFSVNSITSVDVDTFGSFFFFFFFFLF
jgi:hypothetical protein